MKTSTKKTIISTLALSGIVCAATALGGVLNAAAEPAASESYFSMYEKAAVRLKDPNGLRFYATMDESKALEVNKTDDEVTFGMLVVPYELLTKNNVTSKYVTELVEIYGKENLCLIDDLTAYYNEEIGSYCVNGVITDIKYNNISRDFVGIGYVKTGDGETATYEYASVNLENVMRKSSWVAAAALTDTKKSYSDNDKAVLNTYVDKAVMKAIGQSEDAYNTAKTAGTLPTLTAVANKTYAGMLAGEKVSLSVAYNASYAGTAYENISVDFPVSYASADENVAKVDKNGNVTAVAEGKTEITITTVAGKLTCTVEVGSLTITDMKNNLGLDGNETTPASIDGRDCMAITSQHQNYHIYSASMNYTVEFLTEMKARGYEYVVLPIYMKLTGKQEIYNSSSFYHPAGTNDEGGARIPMNKWFNMLLDIDDFILKGTTTWRFLAMWAQPEADYYQEMYLAKVPTLTAVAGQTYMVGNEIDLAEAFVESYDALSVTYGGEAVAVTDGKFVPEKAGAYTVGVDNYYINGDKQSITATIEVGSLTITDMKNNLGLDGNETALATKDGRDCMVITSKFTYYKLYKASMNYTVEFLTEMKARGYEYIVLPIYMEHSTKTVISNSSSFYHPAGTNDEGGAKIPMNKWFNMLLDIDDYILKGATEWNFLAMWELPEAVYYQEMYLAKVPSLTAVTGQTYMVGDEIDLAEAFVESYDTLSVTYGGEAVTLTGGKFVPEQAGVYTVSVDNYYINGDKQSITATITVVTE